MNRIIIIILLLVSVNGFSQTIFGKWKTVDGESGEAKSIVEIYERDGKVFGKIIDILNPDNKNALCTKCKGDSKGKPVLGFELIKDMKKVGDEYKNGIIFNPENGKEYKCRLKLTKNADVLRVRGYIAFLYATQYWERVKE